MRLVALALALALPGLVDAQAGLGLEPDDDHHVRARQSEARDAFEAGREAFTEARYAAAVELWNRAYALEPHPFLLINIGNAWAALHNPERAASAYGQYLEVAPDDADERPTVEEWLRHLEGEPSLARSTPDPWADPLAGRSFTWIAGSVAVVGAGLALGLYLDAESRFGGMMRGCGATASCDPASVNSLSTELTASHVLFGLSAVALAATLTLWIVEGVAFEGSAAERLAVGPEGVGLRF